MLCRQNRPAGRIRIAEDKKMLKQEEMIEVNVAEKNIVASAVTSTEQGMNTIFKGSKVTGNMVVRQDLQMNGDLEGNITAENNASIFIKGIYKGNIDAKGGSVEVEGEMSGGNISAGGYVKGTDRKSTRLNSSPGYISYPLL